MSEVPPFLQRPEEQDNLGAITPSELSLIQDLIAEGATREEVERQILLERESDFGFEEFTFEEDDSGVVVEEFETTPLIGEEDLVKEDHVDEPEDGAAKDERLKQESLARSEAEAGKDDEDSSEDLIGKLTSGAADIVENLIANTETSRFSDRGVLGEENIVRDMRYPIDALQADVSKLPAVVSFEFFKRSSNSLSELSGVFDKSTLTGFGAAIGTGIADTFGFGDESDELVSIQNRNETIIQEQYAQGIYSGTTQEALSQVKDIRLNRASEQSMDRIFMYVPNSIQFTDTFDYEEKSQATLRGFYEMAAGNSKAVSEQIRQGAAGFLSKQVGGFTDTLTGGAVQFDPYNSLRSAIGLAANDRNEQSFKGVQRKSFQFTFQFAPTSPKEAVMMQNIIQSFRFHSSPELAESTTQFFAPHEVDVKFFRNSLIQDGSQAMVDTFGRTALVSEVYSGNANERKSLGKLVENTEIPRIGRCFVTSVNVNYTPQAKSSFFVNGVATEVTMAVTLQQAIMTNKQFILQGF